MSEGLPTGAAPAPAKALPPLLKFVLEFGPLALFFLCYGRFGIFVATGVMMAAVVVTLAVSYARLRRLPIMPVVTAVIVVVFGSFTLIFHDETLIKLKPTVLYLLFSGALFFGLIFNKPMLQIMFDGALNVTPRGWRLLTWRWAIFFLALALLNEIIWRNVTTEHWVAFKTFGFLPITLIFAIAQTPLILKHAADAGEGDDPL